MIARRNGRSAAWAALLGATALVLALASGCASLDATQVEAARGAVEAASGDANIDPSSDLNYQESVRHLALAEKALDAGRWQEVTDHEAYMATTLAAVAVTQGEANALAEATLGALDQARRDTRRTKHQVQAASRRAQALQAQETERGLVLTLGGVLFEFDSADLKPEAQLSVARVAGFLIASDDRNLIVEGYTDDVGTEEYNFELSARRAEAVKAALVANHVEATRIGATGHGPMYPVADNDSDQGRARNRRVEIVILDPGESLAEGRRQR